MTALKEFDRFEATGLWRATPQDQRREVIVSMGDATLTMSDTAGRIMAHWSIAAIVRANGSEVPAIFHPDGDPGETLELARDEAEMIAGIDKLLRVIDRRRPRPGKLRFVISASVGALLAGALAFWLPDALERYTVQVVPPVKRTEIGQSLLARMIRVTGQPCANPQAQEPLQLLATRILGEARRDKVLVVPGGVRDSVHLPGGFVMLNRAIIEDFEDADVPAGYLVAEAVRASLADPLAAMLDQAGLIASLRLLTTGDMPEDALDAYAEILLTRTQPNPDPEALLSAFATAELRSTPYAFARDITGESTLALIEADPRAEQGSRVVLSDSNWVRLQGICGG